MTALVVRSCVKDLNSVLYGLNGFACFHFLSFALLKGIGGMVKPRVKGFRKINASGQMTLKSASRLFFLNSLLSLFFYIN